MVAHRGLVLWTPDDRMFSEAHETIVLQLSELPFDETVVEGIQASGDERPSPIDGRPKALQVNHCLRREVLRPVDGVTEPYDLVLRDTHVSHDPELHLLSFGDPVGRRDNRQTRAVECLRHEHVVPSHPHVPSQDLRVQKGDPEPQMEVSVHVGVWNIQEELRLPFAGIGLKSSGLLPLLLPL